MAQIQNHHYCVSHCHHHHSRLAHHILMLCPSISCVYFCRDIFCLCIRSFVFVQRRNLSCLCREEISRICAEKSFIFVANLSNLCGEIFRFCAEKKSFVFLQRNLSVDASIFCSNPPDDDNFFPCFCLSLNCRA